MSSHESHRIAKAFLTAPNEGVVELSHDWKAQRLPRISFGGERDGFLKVEPIPASDFAFESRYYVDKNNFGVFVFDPIEHPIFEYEELSIYLAGSFNGWQDAVGKAKWRMSRTQFEGREVYSLKLPLELLNNEGAIHFKFVTDQHYWIPADSEAPNFVSDDEGNGNYRFNLRRSGRHRLRFRLSRPLDLSENHSLVYHGRLHSHEADLDPGPFFFDLKSDKPLGAIVDGARTTFRLFAPRAKWVKVGVFQKGESKEKLEWTLMERSNDYVWEAVFPRNLTGARYWYRLDGPSGPSGNFDPDFKILDPYAKATLSREGPGIVVDEKAYSPVCNFQPAAWQDLILMEAHARDLVAGIPEIGKNGVPLGFSDLNRSVQEEKFYPATMGINALELQPVQENDSQSYAEYHWGYMTTNFFSPASSYASDPESASQIEEFRDLVSSIHSRGMAVILDVVYNHLGEPAHLMYIDKLYYFHLEGEGVLTNWSGCGNDMRCDAPMSRRLIVESLKHLVAFYGVDGFRFDLADLVGKAALQEVERELKSIKPDVILIAEPWSFRGHIGRDLRDTGFASWNDGYRESIKSYVRGGSSSETLSYFLMGSPGDYASWPAQTVNYTESHDDRTWIDVITEHAENNGSHPSVNDQRRTRMMAAIMMMSIGIPMIHAGQDFLFSKNGVNNTYQRGDLNALDYDRRIEYALTSDYFKDWISFRKSDLGELVRHYSRANRGFFDFIETEGRNALAAVFNADRSKGKTRLLFAVNPELEPLRIPLGNWEADWIQLADHDRFWGFEEKSLNNNLRSELTLPPLGTGLWVWRG
jgi:pullulanase/glycogen debranching enzyme